VDGEEGLEVGAVVHHTVGVVDLIPREAEAIVVATVHEAQAIARTSHMGKITTMLNHGTPCTCSPIAVWRQLAEYYSGFDFGHSKLAGW
jgi:hypothetical protein